MGRGIRYTSVGEGRRVAAEQIKLILTLALTGCVLIALETTALSRIPLPGFGGTAAGAPALGLLFSMAVGFLHGEREGGITGLLTGWITDAALGGESTGGIMLLPLLYFLCGYMSGTVGKRRLAHNLPSFMVFSAVGGGLKCLTAISVAAVRLRALPPAVWTVRGFIPSLILTVLFSAAVYGIVKGEQWLMRAKS